jgi:hypothetical protein
MSEVLLPKRICSACSMRSAGGVPTMIAAPHQCAVRNFATFESVIRNKQSVPILIRMLCKTLLNGLIFLMFANLRQMICPVRVTTHATAFVIFVRIFIKAPPAIGRSSIKESNDCEVVVPYICASRTPVLLSCNTMY